VPFVDVEIPARLFLGLLGNDEIIVGPARDPAYLRSNRCLHGIQVTPNFG
jgi:hypothetical protein